MAGRYLGKADTDGLAPQQPIYRNGGRARNDLLRFSRLHQNELQSIATGRFGHDLHLLYLDVDQGIRLHQAAVKRQILSEPGDLALHVAETALHLFVALAIDTARHIGRRELFPLSAVFRFQPGDARTRRQRAAYGIHHSKARIVSAEFECGIDHAHGEHYHQHPVDCPAPGCMRTDDEFAKQVRHEKWFLPTSSEGTETLHELRPHALSSVPPVLQGTKLALAEGFSRSCDGDLVCGP